MHLCSYRGLLLGEVFVKLTLVTIICTVNIFPYHSFCGFVTDHDSNVLPGGGAPVGIVITFLWHFKSPSLPICVLPGVNCTVTFQVLISGKQTCEMIAKKSQKDIIVKDIA